MSEQGQQYDIIRRQYSTDEKLRLRQEIHDRYTVPNRSFAEWALSCVPWRGDEWVLDLGCGTGLYHDKLSASFPTINYIGMDIQLGMLLAHNLPNSHLAQGDAIQLPFADASFDVVMANHMLYHVENPEAAVREIQRVLRPDGMMMVATNSMQTMPELQVLMRRAIAMLSRGGVGQVRAPALPSDAFALENGTRILSRHFFAIVRHDFPSALVFPEPEPAMAYLESTRDLREPQLPAEVMWDDVMMIMRQQINQLVKHLGELVINKQVGVLVATQRGGFITGFLAHQQRADG